MSWMICQQNSICNSIISGKEGFSQCCNRKSSIGYTAVLNKNKSEGILLKKTHVISEGESKAYCNYFYMSQGKIVTYVDLHFQVHVKF